MGNEEERVSTSKPKKDDSAVEAFMGILVLIAIIGYIAFVRDADDLTTKQKWGLGIGSVFVGGWIFLGAWALIDKAMKFIVTLLLVGCLVANVFAVFWLATSLPFTEEAGKQWIGALLSIFGADLLLFLSLYPLARLTGISPDKW